jgi:hypothetical protein
MKNNEFIISFEIFSDPITSFYKTDIKKNQNILSDILKPFGIQLKNIEIYYISQYYVFITLININTNGSGFLLKKNKTLESILSFNDNYINNHNTVLQEDNDIILDNYTLNHILSYCFFYFLTKIQWEENSMKLFLRPIFHYIITMENHSIIMNIPNVLLLLLHTDTSNSLFKDLVYFYNKDIGIEKETDLFVLRKTFTNYSKDKFLEIWKKNGYNLISVEKREIIDNIIEDNIKSLINIHNNNVFCETIKHKEYEPFIKKVAHSLSSVNYILIDIGTSLLSKEILSYILLHEYECISIVVENSDKHENKYYCLYLYEGDIFEKDSFITSCKHSIITKITEASLYFKYDCETFHCFDENNLVKKPIVLHLKLPSVLEKNLITFFTKYKTLMDSSKLLYEYPKLLPFLTKMFCENHTFHEEYFSLLIKIIESLESLIILILQDKTFTPRKDPFGMKKIYDTLISSLYNLIIINKKKDILFNNISTQIQNIDFTHLFVTYIIKEDLHYNITTKIESFYEGFFARLEMFTKKVMLQNGTPQEISLNTYQNIYFSIYKLVILEKHSDEIVLIKHRIKGVNELIKKNIRLSEIECYNMLEKNKIINNDFTDIIIYLIKNINDNNIVILKTQEIIQITNYIFNKEKINSSQSLLSIMFYIKKFFDINY